MKVISCGAIPIATVMMTIAKMHNDGKDVILTDSENLETGKPFWTSIPKHVSKALTIGDTITIVCKPVPGFNFATETFAVKKIMDEGRTSYVIYARDGYSNYLLP